MRRIQVSGLIIILINVFAFSSFAEIDGVTKRIKFAKGKQSATISNAVIRGDEDVYLVGAKAGQKMSVKITQSKATPLLSSRNRAAVISKTPVKATIKLSGRERCPGAAITKSASAEHAEMRLIN